MITVEAGHPHVHHDDVGSDAADRGHCVVAIGCLPDDLEVIGGFEDHPRSRPHECFVVDHEDPDGRRDLVAVRGAI